MALEFEVGEVIVEGDAVRLAFSAGQLVTVSTWADVGIQPGQSIPDSEWRFDVVSNNTDAPAYFSAIPLRNDGGQPSGIVELIIKTADAIDADWDNAPVLLGPERIDLSSAIVQEPVWEPMFPITRYGKYLRLYYDVLQPLENAVFYSFITNQPMYSQRLAFVEVSS